MTDELARVLVFPLWNGDQEVIRQIAGAYLNSEYLTGIRVVTEYGDVLYDHFPEGADKVLIREAMIRQGDHYFGQVQLQFSRQSIERRQRSTIVAVIIIGLPLITVIIVGAHFAMRRLLNESSKTSF